MRCSHLHNGFCHSFNFVRRPRAEAVPLRIVAAPKFLSLAADRALGVQAIIAAVKLLQFQFERPVIVRASDNSILPKLLHDLILLFC